MGDVEMKKEKLGGTPPMRAKITNYPFMHDDEIAVMDAQMKQYEPKICLEWGSGGSTIYYPKKFKFIKQWVSIEHSGAYAKFLRDKVDSKKVILLWAHEYHYIDLVKNHLRRYDFIFIDGQEREKCLEASRNMLKPNGFVILHDSGRKEYWNWMRRIYGSQEKLIEGRIPARGGGFTAGGLTKFWL